MKLMFIEEQVKIDIFIHINKKKMLDTFCGYLISNKQNLLSNFFIFL